MRLNQANADLRTENKSVAKSLPVARYVDLVVKDCNDAGREANTSVHVSLYSTSRDVEFRFYGYLHGVEVTMLLLLLIAPFF